MPEEGQPWELVRTATFLHALKKYLRKHPDRAGTARSVLTLLTENPRAPKLHLHALGGKFQGIHAARLGYGDRIVLVLAIRDRQIILLDIGTHDDVYR